MRGQIINVGAAGYNNPGKFAINYVIAVTSAANLNVILTDSNNIPFFHGRAATNQVNSMLCLNGQEINGIKCPTFTNCTRVIIGVDRLTDGA